VDLHLTQNHVCNWVLIQLILINKDKEIVTSARTVEVLDLLKNLADVDVKATASTNRTTNFIF